MLRYVLAFIALSAPLQASTYEPDSTVFIFDYTTADLAPFTGVLSQAPLNGESVTLRFGMQFSGLFSSAPDGTYSLDYSNGSFPGLIDAWILTPGWSGGGLTWTFHNGNPSIEGMLLSQSFANSLSVSQEGDDWQPDPETRYFSTEAGQLSLVESYFSCQFICGVQAPGTLGASGEPPANVPLPATAWMLLAGLATLGRSSIARLQGRWQIRCRCSA